MRFVSGTGMCRLVLKNILKIFWYIGQKLAPFLDHFDRVWTLEASSYCVVARKGEIDATDRND